MKKSIIKTIAAIMLFSFAFSAVLLFGCKKNVGDVYDYALTVLAPDFEISAVDYAFDNEALNSESELSFKVTYKNAEVTETTYSSVLNFYVDGDIQQSVLLEDLAANTEYEKFFDWSAIAGNHDFKFEINLSSDGSTIIEETNTTNNSQTESLDIEVKQLVVVSEVAVDPAEVNQIISSDTEANIAGVLASEGITVSTTVDPIKTTYSDNTSAIVAAVAKSDGTIDETKVVLSAKTNPGVTQGQQQEANITLVVETLVAQKKVSFYNANEELSFTDGIITYAALKSANAGCEEPSNMEMFYANQAAKDAFSAALFDAMAELGEFNGLAAAPGILISTLVAFNLTQGDVDNPPTYSYEVKNGNTICSNDCENNLVVYKFPYPGFVLKFKDDRGTIPDHLEAPNCTASNNGEYTFEDCGGNEVTFIFNSTRSVIKTTNHCVPDVHN